MFDCFSTVMASGNGYNFDDNVNDNGYANSRYTISVGAVGKDGNHASYSTPGAALFLTAPGGDHEYVSNVSLEDIYGC